MSIVYEYLKQIQEKNQTLLTPSVPPKRRRAFLPLVSVSILIAVILLIFFLFLSHSMGRSLSQILPKPKEITGPAPATVSTSKGAMLEGIIYNPTHPFAIFSGKMMEVGGRVEDDEVMFITPDSVTLKNLKDHSSRTLRL